MSPPAPMPLRPREWEARRQVGPVVRGEVAVRQDPEGQDHFPRLRREHDRIEPEIEPVRIRNCRVGKPTTDRESFPLSLWPWNRRTAPCFAPRRPLRHRRICERSTETSADPQAGIARTHARPARAAWGEDPLATAINAPRHAATTHCAAIALPGMRCATVSAIGSGPSS